MKKKKFLDFWSHPFFYETDPWIQIKVKNLFSVDRATIIQYVY